MADTAWTIWVVHRELAIEANPLMAHLVNYNVPAFVAIKTSVVLAFAVMLELIPDQRRKNRFAHTAFGLFVVLYCIWSIC
jgi:hypothetical protein